MSGNEILMYIRENQIMLMGIVVGSVILCLLFILFHVVRTHRELRNICKKIHRYFDVILSEEESEDTQFMEADEIPVSEAKISTKNQEESLQKQRDAKLLMDVISDVF